MISPDERARNGSARGGEGKGCVCAMLAFVDCVADDPHCRLRSVAWLEGAAVRREILWRLFLAILLLGLAAVPRAIAEDRGTSSIAAQAAGRTLTGQNLQDLFAIYDWLLEDPLNDKEKTSLTPVLIEEFKKNPATVANNYVTIHQLLPQLLSATLTQQARRRAEMWQHLIETRATDPTTVLVLKILADHPSVLLFTDQGVVTRQQIDAIVASDDNVAEAAGLPRATPDERSRITREILAAFPGFSPKEDRFEAIADAEERCLSLRDFVESSPEHRAAVVADITAHVHQAQDVPREARTLENNALLMSRMHQFAVQQQIIAGVTAQYQSQIEAIREAGDRFMWHESRAYAHGEAKPGPHTGLGPD
jgi:hypothetical protein